MEYLNHIDGHPVYLDGDNLVYKGRRLPRVRGASPAAGTMQGPAASAPTASVAVVPFDQAAHRGMEPGKSYSGITPGSSEQTFGPDPLPAQGYLRRVLIEVICTGGADSGTPVAAADYPFNILSNVQLQDTNGAPLTELSGYNLFLANTYGRYAGTSDPRNDPDYSADLKNPRFCLIVPVEIAANGLGALANQSASAAYRLRVKVAAEADIWSTPPTTVPDVEIRITTDFWTLPASADMLGRRQQQAPPFEGTAQYWTQQQNNSVNSGGNNTRISRVGNLIRTLIFVARESGVRNDAPFPDPYTLNWDSRDLRSSTPASVLRKEMREYIPELVARDTGVYVFTFSYGEDRYAGALGINSWLATVTATRLELDGTSGNAGTLDILVNDVSVAEVMPAARAVEVSATGYHPPVAPTVMGAQ